MERYRTFTRSATSMAQFAKARKRPVDRGLTLEQARRACANFNDNRTADQVRKGTKMEFESY